MTRLAIVQPNFLPWRGAFDLIDRADIFIFLDNVQYTKRDWRNRNRVLLLNGQEKWLTVPVKAPGLALIKDVAIHYQDEWRRNHLRTLQTAYGGTPGFGLAQSLLEDAYAERPERLVDLTIPLTIRIARLLGITTNFLIASELDSVPDQKNERLIAYANQVGASSYLSGPSAVGYLDRDTWERAGIELEIITYPDYPTYPQIGGASIPSLSIYDLICMTGECARRYIWPKRDIKVQPSD